VILVKLVKVKNGAPFSKGPISYEKPRGEGKG
jgi:hypothetical protein